MPNYNYYPNYTPYANAYAQQPVQQPTYQQAPPPQPQNGIIWVQGEAAAKAYPVAAGSNVLLMDSEGKCFYIKSTDPSGMPMPLRVFEYTEVAKTEPVPMEQSHAALPDFQQFARKEDLMALEQKIDDMSKTITGTKQRIERKEKDDGK